ncbi:MAG: ChaN family lipoprotein [Bacteroidia bacterium]|nr:ChaN family lipoprotein [Bacteroidia bacterium]
MAQDKPAYTLYTSSGKKTTWTKAVADLYGADIVCFGELHNNPIAHWLTLELLRDLTTLRGADHMATGMEMLETDQDTALQAYLSGQTDRKTFETSVKLWDNYPTDYRPVVSFCQAQRIPVLATNVPRSYARLVSRGGPAALDTLPPAERALLAPLPYPIDYDLPGYQAMREMMAGHGGSFNPDHFVAAQALKDATMAHRILRGWKPGTLVLHLNGSYHSDNHEGIVWYLNHYRKGLTIKTLTVVEQDNILQLDAEHRTKADYIIVVPTSMTKTYLSDFE